MLVVCGMMAFLAINVGIVLFWRHVTGSLVLAFGIQTLDHGFHGISRIEMPDPGPSVESVVRV